MRSKAYITGADRGLGFALTKSLLENGYIVFAGSYMPKWTQLSELNEIYPTDLTLVPLDVSDDLSVNQAANLIASKTDSLDLLINNAAIATDRSGTILEDLHFDDMRKMLEINTFGPLRVTHSVIKLLLNGERKLLVNISSEAGSIKNCWRVNEFAYSMSKASLNMQSAILQNHLREYGVKVLAIHPGWLKTYMLGDRNEKATLEAEESAYAIMKILLSKELFTYPMFIDHEGNEMQF